jgi:phytoene dehydrogenase-like protein
VLVEVLEGLGGSVETSRPIRTLGDLPEAGAVIFALTPGQVHRIAGTALPGRTARRYRRYRYGPGACKVDLAIDGPIPWTHPDVAQAGTVHLGGTFEEVAEAEAAVGRGRNPERPFVLLAQHTGFDPTRAPAGVHTVWAYCHVPNGSAEDRSAAIEAQIERFAPGFGERVVARRVSGPADLERGNANLVGGDVGGGAYTGLQAVFRPGLTLDPYRTGNDRLFIGSAGTTPGGGVHGMAGHLAARRALIALDRSRR